MDTSEVPEWMKDLEKELKEKLPGHLLTLLKQRDSAARLIQELPKRFTPKSVGSPTDEQRAWELAGLWYLNQGRYREALPIFIALYEHMLAAQEETGNWSHKGMPLCWIGDCYSAMNSPVLAKRYLMLTLCEDAIGWKGDIDPDITGIYFRLVWQYGLADKEFRDYSGRMYKLSKNESRNWFYPEWVLQALDRSWMTEFPSPREAKAYIANTRYIRYLISKLGESTGKTLELLADYILSCMPGCRTMYCAPFFGHGIAVRY